jgi:hypothetical protein
MLKQARLKFWLSAMDAIALAGGFGSTAYLWCVARASGCVDWDSP